MDGVIVRHEISSEGTEEVKKTKVAVGAIA